MDQIARLAQDDKRPRNAPYTRKRRPKFYGHLARTDEIRLIKNIFEHIIGWWRKSIGVHSRDEEFTSRNEGYGIFCIKHAYGMFLNFPKYRASAMYKRLLRANIFVYSSV